MRGGAPCAGASFHGGRVSEASMSDALECSKFAAAALKERNVERAFSFLAQALNTLQPGSVRG